MQTSVDVTMYSAQVPWPSSGAKQATLLPISPRPINPPPEAMTVPLPSNPGTTGNDLVIPYWPFQEHQIGRANRCRCQFDQDVPGPQGGKRKVRHRERLRRTVMILQNDRLHVSR